MNDFKRNPRTTNFADTLAARLGDELTERQRAAIVQLAHELLDKVPEDLPPQSRDVTVLMADLRGFSDLTSSSDPDTLVALLQPFFSRMTTVIHEHGGFVDKFLGDGVMALFGAPTPGRDHLHRALCCAVQMQRVMLEINEANAAQGLPPMYAGIGINSGTVMAGAFGSKEYFEYTVIGDDVNLAARVQTFALRGEVLLSENSFKLSQDAIEVADVRHLRVKGRGGPVTLYQLGAVTGPQRIEVPAVEMRSSPRVPVDIPLRFHAIENHRVLSQEREGSIVNLGYDGMLARLPQPLPELGEITFGLAPEPTATDYEDVYARALHQREDGDIFETAFAFTSIGTRGREAVRRYVDQSLWGTASL